VNVNASADGSAATADTPTTPSPNEPGSAARPAASVAVTPLNANTACRTLAHQLTAKACDCPQANRKGCCFFGSPWSSGANAGKTPYVECSQGKTNWPALVEQRLCTNATDDAKSILIQRCMASLSGLQTLQCGKSTTGEPGALVPRDCESLFN
jgi:hypothetical protein